MKICIFNPIKYSYFDKLQFALSIVDRRDGLKTNQNYSKCHYLAVFIPDFAEMIEDLHRHVRAYCNLA